LLHNARRHPEMQRQYDIITSILYTADLAKFAKAQPLPHEHTMSMEQAKQFIINTPSVVTTAETQNTDKQS